MSMSGRVLVPADGWYAANSGPPVYLAGLSSARSGSETAAAPGTVYGFVIVPVAFIAGAPCGVSATILRAETRHFYLAETRHLNLGPTVQTWIIYIMSNIMSKLTHGPGNQNIPSPS